MHELVKADDSACEHCAAKTRSFEGYVCVPWKLGTSNKNKGKNHRIVIGRTHKTGTTMRPKDCPHPESAVATTSNAQVMLKRILGK